MKKPITQEDLMGCSVACVAFALNKSYKSTKSLFDKPKDVSFRGYYCREIVKALKRGGLNYKFSKLTQKNKEVKKKLNNFGTIVFIKRNKKYPQGHYLVKTKRSWMNPWINFSSINPAKSGFKKKLPGKPQWIIYHIT